MHGGLPPTLQQHRGQGMASHNGQLVLDVLESEGFDDAAATLEDLRAQLSPNRRLRGDAKKFAIAWAQIAAAVVRDDELFDERARQNQQALLKGACQLPSGSGAPNKCAGASPRIDDDGNPRHRGRVGDFWTTAPDMARSFVREQLARALESATAEAEERFPHRGCSLPSKCLTPEKCEGILKPFLRDDLLLRHMLNEKLYPMRLRILAEIIYLRVTWPQEHKETTLKHIPAKSYFGQGDADAVCAGPTPWAEHDFVVVRGKQNGEFRPFAKPSVDLANVLAAIARETVDEADEFSGSKKAQSKKRSRVYKRAWHSGFRAPPHIKKAKKHQPLLYEPKASTCRANLNEKLRSTLEEIYKAARPYLYAQLLPHELAKQAFNVRDWLGEGGSPAPSIPLLAAVWLDLGAILAHTDPDPGLAFMVACAWDAEDGKLAPHGKRARAPSPARGQNVRGSGFYFPDSGPDGIYVSLRQGDILLFNPSAPHCVTEPWYESERPSWLRVRSLVSCYLNRDMIGVARAAQKTGSTISATP